MSWQILIIEPKYSSGVIISIDLRKYIKTETSIIYDLKLDGITNIDQISHINRLLQIILLTYLLHNKHNIKQYIQNGVDYTNWNIKTSNILKGVTEDFCFLWTFFEMNLFHNRRSFGTTDF